MRIDVLNPDGRDAPVDYRAGVGKPDPAVHPPVNYWAFAAATDGRFHQRLETLTEPCDAIVVLLRRRNRAALRAVRLLKRRGHRVFVSWKETGLHQIDQQTGWWWQRLILRRLMAEADGAIATTEAALDRYRRFAPPTAAIHFIPTPYPVDLPEWDFSMPVEQRNGILVGTREFDVPTRRHVEALKLATDLAQRCAVPLTVISDGDDGRIREICAGSQLQIVPRLPYPDYLRMLARHRIVLQLDASQVPGQVAGDALLCRSVCVGGNGATERIAFPQYARLNDSPPHLLAAAQRLLNEESVYLAAVEQSQQTALARLSFGWARRALPALTAMS
jgi:hypothetical protein